MCWISWARKYAPMTNIKLQVIYFKNYEYIYVYDDEYDDL